MRRPGFMRVAYMLTLFLITLTGFAQMPIFKRYYIADLPGLGWLAEFYVTHYLHYLSASVLLLLMGYAAADHAVRRKQSVKVTGYGMAKMAILCGLVVTGGLLVLRNFPGTLFSSITISVLDIAHLGLCVALLVMSGVAALKRSPWVQQPESLKMLETR